MENIDQVRSKCSTRPYRSTDNLLRDSIIGTMIKSFALGDVANLKIHIVFLNSIYWAVALRWMPQDLIDDKSTLVQVMACYRKAKLIQIYVAVWLQYDNE